jgi:hypothetical protein
VWASSPPPANILYFHPISISYLILILILRPQRRSTLFFFQYLGNFGGPFWPCVLKLALIDAPLGSESQAWTPNSVFARLHSRACYACTRA